MTHEDVVVRRDYTHNWTLNIPSSAQTTLEQREELLDILSMMFDNFGGFIIPREIVYGAGQYEPAADLCEIRNSLEYQKDVEEVIVRNNSGVTFDDLSDSIEDHDPTTTYVSMVTFKHLGVKISFDEGTEYVDRNNRTVRYRPGKENDVDSNVDPLRIRLGHGPSRGCSGIDSSYHFFIEVIAQSTIWFEGDENAECNGENLSNFLERLYSALPVENIRRYTDYDTTDNMEKIF